MEAQLLETVHLKEEEGGGGGQVGREMMVTTRGMQENGHLDLRLGISLKGFGDMGGGGGGSTTGEGPSGAKGGGGQVFTSAATGSLCVGGVVPQQPARVVCNSSTTVGAKRWFPEAVGSFVDPWSLAARQETAVLEQRSLAYRRNVYPAPPSHTVPRVPTPSPVVGWPPVRAFRKNLVTSLHPNPERDMKKDLKKTKPSEGDIPAKHDMKPTMFVKVNMEGYNVGRKIDLMAHRSYESLSCALQKMFHNFLSAASYSNSTKQDAQDEPVSANYILLYEDHEGDQLLVGDVPWEIFICSVKRLYIANGSKEPKPDDVRGTENDKSKQFEHEVKSKG